MKNFFISKKFIGNTEGVTKVELKNYLTILLLNTDGITVSTHVTPITVYYILKGNKSTIETEIDELLDSIYLCDFIAYNTLLKVHINRENIIFNTSLYKRGGVIYSIYKYVSITLDNSYFRKKKIDTLLSN
jgi:hypothetical protein